MNNKLPHLKPRKDNWTPSINTIWDDYEITEEEITKHSWLKKLKHSIEHTGDKIEINKDKTLLNVYNSFGDETLFDMKTGKIIDYSLGF